MADSILQMLGIRPADINLLRDRGVPLDQPMPYDPSYQVPGSPPAQRVGDVAGGALQALPSVGDAYSVLQAIADLEAGNYGDAALNGVNALPMVAGMGAIKAFHGSPHKFDAFDISKVGTGEGAQAYGHGLYFAESPETAKSYRSALSSERGFEYNGQSGLTREQVQDLVNKNYDGSKFLDGVSRPSLVADHVMDDMVLGSVRKDNYRPRQYKEGSERDLLYQDLSQKIKHTDPGALYEASLEWPDPAREASDPLGPQHFLDWDKPLSEQKDILSRLGASRSKILKGTLESMGDLSEPRSVYGVDLGLRTGEDLMRSLSLNMEGKTTSVKASSAISKTGIPGIRYLDQGSRGAGDGTYNYVVFDDKIPKIVSRNGEKAASSVLSDIGHQPTEFELAHQTAQKNAALPVEQGGLGLPADNTAMDRAKAMGFDTPAYHGTNADFSEFDAIQGKSRTDAPSFANFFTSSPKNASSYAGRRKGGNVMPVLLKTDNPVDFEATGPWSQMESPISGSAYDFRYGNYRDINPGSLIDINTLSSLAKKAGNDSVVVRNLADYGGRSGELADTSILFDPRNIRSRFAAFDPMNRNSANILAGSLLGSLGLQFLEGGGYEDRLP